MFEFEILKQSKKSKARLGVLKTSHGDIETPAFVPCATQAVVRTLTSEEALETGSQLLMCNTFHLHLKPGEKIVKRAGGLHSFMNWKRPIMTDSAGYQVFSLGFGRELGVQKVSKEMDSKKTIRAHQQPKLLKITDEGVLFTSPIDGAKVFIGPRESIRIQEALGADIILAFDECPPPSAPYEYMQKSLLRTHAWAKTCLKSRKSKQALYGILQGGSFKDLRIESARFIGGMPFDGFGIGGEFGADKMQMAKMLQWVNAELPLEKPRHLLGIGYLEDIPEVIRAGVDTFDCIVPTHYARHGVAFTSTGRLDMMKSRFLKERVPLDTLCACFVCAQYTRSYITHLMRAREITALKLLTFHNLFFFHAFVKKLRMGIKKGIL